MAIFNTRNFLSKELRTCVLGRYAGTAKALKLRASQRLHVLVWALKIDHPIFKVSCVLPESLGHPKVLAWRRAWDC